MSQEKYLFLPTYFPAFRYAAFPAGIGSQLSDRSDFDIGIHEFFIISEKEMPLTHKYLSAKNSRLKYARQIQQAIAIFI